MPLPENSPFIDLTVTAFNPVAGTPGGSRVVVPSPARGRLIRAGFATNALVTSGMTMAVAIGNMGLSSTASTFTQCVTSTLGTFSSASLFEGGVCSVSPPSPAYVNAGDPIQFTTSGGDTSANGATFYAIIRKG